MDSVEVTVISQDKHERLPIRRGENLLMAMVNANLPVRFMCTTGKCATCMCKMEIPDGSAAPPSETERYRMGQGYSDEGYRLSCQVYVTGPLTVYL